MSLQKSKMGLEEFGEFLLRRRIVPERNAKFYVSWVRRFLEQPAGLFGGCRNRSGFGLPGPAALNFQLQRHAEERPDEDNQSERGDVLQRGGDNDRPDDVAGHEEFQSQQNGFSQALSIAFEGGHGGLLSAKQIQARGNNGTDDNDHDPDEIQG